MLTQQFTSCPALHGSLLTLADDYATNGSLIDFAFARGNNFLDKALTAALCAEDGFRLGFTDDYQTGIATIRKIAIRWLQIVAVLFQHGQVGYDAHKKCSLL